VRTCLRASARARGSATARLASFVLTPAPARGATVTGPLPSRTRRRSSTRGLLGRLFGSMQRPRLLLAEDDEALRSLLVLSLSEAGYEVVAAGNGVELQAWLDAATRVGRRHLVFDLVITDLRMPGLSGLEVLARLRQTDRQTRVILISAFADAELAREARRLGALAVLAKPFALHELVAAVQAAVPAAA
jgi:CheY-like chemotaxis protein